jgi:hypothetical protein
MVLLKNDGTLPLRRDARLAVLGPHSNSTRALLSNYHGENSVVDEQSPLQVIIRLRLGCKDNCPGLALLIGGA